MGRVLVSVNGGFEMHFLTKVVTQKIDDAVHRRFIKFSVGEFEGPAISVSVKKDSIRFRAAFDYQDFVLEFIINRVPNVECSVRGNIFSNQDFSSELEKLGVKMKKSGANYKAKINTSVPSEKLREVYKSIGDKSTFLISIKPNSGSWNLVMGTNFPKPLAEVKDPTSFCKGRIEANAEVLQSLVDELAPDFRDVIPLPFKSLNLFNTYRISEIVFPENKEKLTPAEIRVQSKRKGVLSRTLEVDEQKFKREIEFLA